MNIIQLGDNCIYGSVQIMYDYNERKILEFGLFSNLLYG